MSRDEPQQLEVLDLNPKADAAFNLPGDLSVYGKVVIGHLEEDKSYPDCEELDLTTAADLQFLHLYNLRNLKTLKIASCQQLVMLDVKHCHQLQQIEIASEQLEILDLKDNPGLTAIGNSLPVSLTRLHMDDCPKLKGPADVSDWLQNQLPRLERLTELTLRGYQPLRKLPRLQAQKLWKIDLQRCGALGELAPIEQLKALQILNLEGCEALKVLPILPTWLQGLFLFGCHQLEQFAEDQDLDATDRGGDAGVNVVDDLLFRQEFKDQLTVSSACKVLLLGNGRAGKTCLSKCLRGIPPSVEEPFTEGVQMHAWETTAEVPEAKQGRVERVLRSRLNRKDLEKLDRAELKKALAMFEDRKCLPTRATIWDFGGQEIYHGTHRLFARASSVFVVVWTDPEILEQRIAKGVGKPEGMSQKEWKRLNPIYDLQYWFDYIYSLADEGETPRILVVCAGGTASKENWRDYAGKKYQDLGSDKKHFNLVDLELIPKEGDQPVCDAGEYQERMEKQPDYPDMIASLRTAMGENELVTLSCFARGAQLMQDWAAKSKAAIESKEINDWGQMPYSAWVANEQVEELLQHGQEFKLKDEHFRALARRLHRTGDLFLLESGQEPHVIVDQYWVLHHGIYKVLHPTWAKKIREERQGRFPGELLLQHPSIHREFSEEKLPVLLQYIEACNLAVRRDRGWRDTEYQALAPAWLPEETDHGPLQEHIENQWQRLQAQFGSPVEKVIDRDEYPLGESRFRALMKALITGADRHSSCLVWKHGIQVANEGTHRPLLIRMEWVQKQHPDGRLQYDGSIKLRVLARDPQARMEDLESFCRSGGVSGRLVSPEEFRSLQEERMPGKQVVTVGISYRSTENIRNSAGGDYVDQLTTALSSFKHPLLKFDVYHYQDKEKEKPDEANRADITESFKALNEAEILIILISHAYLQSKAMDAAEAAKDMKSKVVSKVAHAELPSWEKNEVCFKEFCDAIHLAAQEERKRLTFLLFRTQGKFFQRKNFQERADGFLRAWLRIWNAKADKKWKDGGIHGAREAKEETAQAMEISERLGEFEALMKSDWQRYSKFGEAGSIWRLEEQSKLQPPYNGFIQQVVKDLTEPAGEEQADDASGK